MTKKKSTSSTPRCSNCDRQNTLYSGIKNGESYNNLCDRCIGTLGSSEFFRRYDRQWQRREYAKDIVQTWEPDYAKAYGADAARKAGWTDDQIRKYG